MTKDTWTKVKRSLRKGRHLKDGAYVVDEINDKRVRLIRVATGSEVSVSRSMIEKAADALADGKEIPFRSISYTTAIETGVVAALLAIGAVVVDAENKLYRPAK